MNIICTKNIDYTAGISPDIIAECDHLNNESYMIRNSNTIDSFRKAEEALKLATANHYRKGIGFAHNNLGFYFSVSAQYEAAFPHFEKAALVFEEINCLNGEADVFYNYGMSFIRIGEFQRALEYLQKSLDIRSEIDDKAGMANCYFQFGFIHNQFKEFDLAISLVEKSLNIYTSINDKTGIAAQHMLLGLCYSDKGDSDNAILHLNKSIEIRKTVQDIRGYGSVLYLAGNHYLKNGENNKALQYLIEAEKVAEEAMDKVAKIRIHSCYAKVYLSLNNFDESRLHISQAINIGNESNIKALQPELYELLSILEEKKGNYKEAFTAHKRYTALKAEVYSSEAHMKMKHAAVLQKMEAAKMEAEISHLKNVELKSAFEEIAEKNKEILDSITYARRLQEAILPSKSQIQKDFANGFVLYLPKDIVAGDFYWLHDDCKENTLYFAACDCTGHGVPGAMVSVVCSNALNRSVNEFELKDPGLILDKTRELVIETFSKSEEDVKDGMDISIAFLNKQTNVLFWAGANNPLWIVRDGKLLEWNPDKQPIGNFTNQKCFTSHEIELKKNDMVYLFTDGFADQFGGPAGKKFKYQQLAKLLGENNHLSSGEMKNRLHKTFIDWKGTLEQVDDVCILGLRI